VAVRSVGLVVTVGDLPGQPPVDDDGLAERPDQHVGWLEVAVDDAVVVRVGEGLGRGDQVRQERKLVVGCRGAGRCIGERGPFDQLHRKERLAARPVPDLVQRDDRRMLQARGDSRLAAEAADRLGGGVEQDLDGHRPVVPPVPGAQDPPHAAARDLVDDEVVVGCHGACRERRSADVPHRARVAVGCRRPDVPAHPHAGGYDITGDRPVNCVRNHRTGSRRALRMASKFAR
jgi:hypothetical protein